MLFWLLNTNSKPELSHCPCVMTQVGVGTNATEDPIPPSFKLDLTLFRWVFGALCRGSGLLHLSHHSPYSLYPNNYIGCSAVLCCQCMPQWQTTVVDCSHQHIGFMGLMWDTRTWIMIALYCVVLFIHHWCSRQGRKIFPRPICAFLYARALYYRRYAVCAMAVVGKAIVSGIRASVSDILIQLTHVHQVVAYFTHYAIWHSCLLMISTVCWKKWHSNVPNLWHSLLQYTKL